MINLQQMFNMFNMSANPMQLVAQQFSNHPNYSRAMQMLQGKNPQQLQQVAMNLANQMGMPNDQMQQVMQMASKFGFRP